MLIDTHAHINFNAFRDDGHKTIKRALDQDTWMINVGSQWETSQRAVDYAKKYPAGVFAAVGLHPFHLVKQEIKAGEDESESAETRPEEFNHERYKTLAQNERVVAIGEAGLDYHYDGIAGDESIKEKQKSVFKKQIELAMELDKPLIVHCRQAHEDVIEILRIYSLSAAPRSRSGIEKLDYGVLDSVPSALHSNNKNGLCGVIHSFSGRWSQAQEYLEMGFFLGFNGIITFARDYDRVARETPLEKIIVETDCPYLTPIPFRGKRNEPSYVKYVAQKIAELKGLTFEEVAEATTRNAKELFNIK